MVVLRILVRGLSFDDASELSFFVESTCHHLIQDFVNNFSTTFADEWIRPPTAGDRLKENMNSYRMMGFPGATTSLDCTMIELGKCPKKYSGRNR